MQLELLVPREARWIGHLDASQNPGLEHRRRCHDAAMNGLAGGLRIGVDRVRVAHRLAPVADHGLDDRVATRLGRTRLDAHVRA